MAEETDYEIKEGPYQVQVHVIEARGLIGRDPGGKSDPMAKVTVLGMTKTTNVKKNCISDCKWDQILFFDFPKLSVDEVQIGQVLVEVFDANSVSRDVIIGSNSIEVEYVYMQPNHQLKKNWIGLADPSEKHPGVQGYIRVSVSVLGPGDKPHVAKDDDDEDDELVLMPPTLESERWMCVMQVLKAEDLPRMDRSGAGADAYVQVSISGQMAQSAVVPSLSPIWNEELHVPYNEPCMGGRVSVSVWDWDVGKSDSLIGVTSFKLARLLAPEPTDTDEFAPPAKAKTFWVWLYGGPPGVGSKEAVRMNNGRTLGTTHRGRLLLRMWKKKTDDAQLGYVRLPRTVSKSFGQRKKKSEFKDPNKLPLSVSSKAAETGEKTGGFRDKFKFGATMFSNRRHISTDEMPRSIAGTEPETSLYTLRCELFEGSEMPQDEVMVEVAFGPNKSVFSDKKKCEERRCVWYQELDELVATLPADIGQLPDVIVYLVCSGKRIAFLRFSSLQLLRHNPAAQTVGPSWRLLLEDKALDKVPEGELAGYLLISLNLYRGSVKIPRPPLERPKTTKYQLRCHIYQAKKLPAKDDDGALDPYIVIRCAGQVIRSDVEERSTYPTWYKTFVLTVDVPTPLELAPDANIMVYDKDKISRDDLAGRFVVSLKDISPEFDTVPKWRELYVERPGDLDGAALLCSFQLILSDAAAHFPAPRIEPKWKRCKIEMTVLGIRGLEPTLLPISKPFLEMGLGDPSHTIKTHPSKNPSPMAPNYLMVAHVLALLPEDILFAPALQLRVVDKKFGLFKESLGVADIPLETYLPWSPTFKETPYLDAYQNDSEDDNNDNNNNNDDDNENTTTQPKKENQKKKNASKQEGTAEETVGLLSTTTTKTHDVGGKGAGTDDEAEITTTARSRRSKRNPDDDEEGGIELGTLKKSAEEPSKEDSTAPAKQSATEDISLEPKWMKGRKIVDEELENQFRARVFHQFPFLRGQGKDLHEVGYFKGYVRVLEEVDEHDTQQTKPTIPALPFKIGKVFNSRQLIARVYIVRAINLVPQDADGGCDAYITIKIGSKSYSYEKEHMVRGTTNPEFGFSADIPVKLPGVSRMAISVWDWDLLSDDMVGRTILDIEDRLFNPDWSSLNPKPVERRTLWSPFSSSQQGKLECWVELLSSKDAKNNPPLDISPPKPKEFELRVVIWKTKGLPSKDEFTNQNDLYIVGEIENFCKPQETDTHWRCKKGNGSFNWRMVFNLSVRPNDDIRLKLSAWDRDIIGSNDAIGAVNLSLKSFFKKAYVRGRQQLFFIEKKKGEDQNRDWLELRHPMAEGPQGQILVTVEAVPKDVADEGPVGVGRAEPNTNPRLPPPTRFKFSLFTPLDNIRECVGDEIFNKFRCCFICLVCCMCLGTLFAILSYFIIWINSVKGLTG